MKVYLGRITALALFWGALASASVAPTTGTVTSQSNRGSKDRFAAVFNDGDGSSNIQVGYVIWGTSSQDKSSSCMIQYNFQTRMFWLLDDRASSWRSTPAGSGMISNSQCSLIGSESSAFIFRKLGYRQAFYLF